MKEQSELMYYDIIDQVCNKLLQEGEPVELTHELVYSLQIEWVNNLKKLQNQYNINTKVIGNKKSNIFLQMQDDNYLNKDGGMGNTNIVNMRNNYPMENKMYVEKISDSEENCYSEENSSYSEENDNMSGDDNEDDILDTIEKKKNCYMMCLFVKVVKIKNKWKCNFKQGFVNFNNDDIPFSTATGELEW